MNCQTTETFRFIQPVGTTMGWLLTVAYLVSAFATPCAARDIYVNLQTGDNTNPGTKSAPLAACKRAVNLAEPGDVIHLLPAGAVYRESILFSNQSDITIEGNGVTLDGADPMPVTGWEQVADQRYRRKINRTRGDGHILVVRGKAERMGRSAGNSSLELYPAPEKLRPGQYCFVPLDQSTGWLYVAGSIQDLHWATRTNGLATRGKCANLRVRNLNARHFLNDGFNIHGQVAGIYFENIQGYDCFDEGLSAHDYCRCEVSDSKFWGCDRAVADVHGSITDYRDCEFRDSADIDVHFRGRRHSLTRCKIINNTQAAALVVGPSDRNTALDLLLKDVHIQGKTAERAVVRITGSQAKIEHSNFEHVEMNTTGSTVTASETTIDGTWTK